MHVLSMAESTADMIIAATFLWVTGIVILKFYTNL